MFILLLIFIRGSLQCGLNVGRLSNKMSKILRKETRYTYIYVMGCTGSVGLDLDFFELTI